MSRRRKMQNTRDAWRLAAGMMLIFLAVVVFGIASKDKKEPDQAWLSDFQVKVETLKQNSPEIQFLYLPVEEKIEELKNGGYNRENLQIMFNMFDSYIVTYFASKASIPGEYGVKYLVHRAVAVNMMAELFAKIREFEGR